ncbi:hypothetical protein [Candidatus Corynebacterium faecigallinarum]|uniref:hypothetical protein n=1 Tax=Candidatus Corynebacterium faecigallinarum TaxID=2838528 RepID=UPI003FCF4B51
MSQDLQRYDRYVSNSSPWLGDLPSHWSIQRTKSLLVERSQKGFPDEPLLASTQSHGVILKSDYATRTVTATKDLHLLKLVEVGDFVISLRSFQGGIERCHHRGIISPAYTVLTAKSDKYRDYLTYLFKSKPFVDSLTLSVTGIREGQNIDYATLAVDLLPVPPDDEQTAIVKYLAHANARITKAIAAKLRLIALLESQKIATVNDGVVDDWPLIPVKRALHSMTAGAWGSAPEESDDPARWCVRVADFDYSSGGVLDSPKTYRAIADREFLKRSLRRSDLLLEGSGGGEKTPVGRVVLFDHDVDALCSNFLQRLRPADNVNPEFLLLMLRRVHASGEVRKYIKQTTGIQNLDLHSYMNHEIPMPSSLEQERAVLDVKAVFREIDAVAARLKQEIALLQEFRTSLVADVVTGQVDVRGVAATLPDAAEADASAANEASPELDKDLIDAVEGADV